MAMKLKDAFTAAPPSLLRLFSTTSTSSFIPLPTAAPDTSARQEAEPNANLFVSGLSKRTTTEGLKEAFSKFGEVVQARVVTDRVSGCSKGFGFVKYASLDDAAKGREGMHGKFLDGWVIFAEYARPRPSPAASGSNASAAYEGNRNSPYGNNSSNPSYRNSVPSYLNSMASDKEAVDTRMAYGNNTDGAYRSLGYRSRADPATGYRSDTGPAYENTSDAAYRNNTTSEYGSNKGHGYGSNPVSEYGSNNGHGYENKKFTAYSSSPSATHCSHTYPAHGNNENIGSAYGNATDSAYGAAYVSGTGPVTESTSGSVNQNDGSLACGNTSVPLNEDDPQWNSS